MSTENAQGSADDYSVASRRLNIIGLGPAGAILAIRAVAHGWHVTAYDPGATEVDGSASLPEWPANYGIISTEIPDWAQGYFHPREDIRVRTEGERFQTLGFGYHMLDYGRISRKIRELTQKGLLRIFPFPLSPGEALQLSGKTVDCRGAIANDAALWQIALGYVLPKNSKLPASLSTPTLMDWSPSPAAVDHRGPASFLYVQETAAGWLVEETILVTDKPPSERLFDTLRQRLESRIDAEIAQGWRGDDPGAVAQHVLDVERVAIPMGTAAKHSPIPCFGARAGFIHPATGYSLGTALQEVDAFLLQLKVEKRNAAHHLRRLIQRLNARLAHVLRRIGSLLLVEASPSATRSFFAAFFNLDTQNQLAYLSGRSGVATAKTMWRLRKNTGWAHPVLQPLYRRPLKFLRAGMRSN